MWAVAGSRPGTVHTFAVVDRVRSTQCLRQACVARRLASCARRNDAKALRVHGVGPGVAQPLGVAHALTLRVRFLSGVAVDSDTQSAAWPYMCQPRCARAVWASIFSATTPCGMHMLLQLPCCLRENEQRVCVRDSILSKCMGVLRQGGAHVLGSGVKVRLACL